MVRGAAETALELPRAEAIGVGALNRRVLEAFDKVDRGEDTGPIQDWRVVQYRLRPDLRQQIRSQVIGDPRELAGYKAAEAGGKRLAEALPVTPEQQATMPYQLGQGFGSTATFALGGVLGPVGVAGAGAAVNAAQQFEDAIAHGASLEDATTSAQWGGLTGTSEAVPISRWFDRFDKGTGGTLRRAIVEGIKGGLEEATQETFQQAASNLIASGVVKYDPERGTFEGVGPAAGVGFTVGGLFSFIASALGARMRGPGQMTQRGELPPPPEPTVEPGEPAPRPVEPIKATQDLRAFQAEARAGTSIPEAQAAQSSAALERFRQAARPGSVVSEAEFMGAAPLTAAAEPATSEGLATAPASAVETGSPAPSAGAANPTRHPVESPGAEGGQVAPAAPEAPGQALAQPAPTAAQIDQAAEQTARPTEAQAEAGNFVDPESQRLTEIASQAGEFDRIVHEDVRGGRRPSQQQLATELVAIAPDWGIKDPGEIADALTKEWARSPLKSLRDAAPGFRRAVESALFGAQKPVEQRPVPEAVGGASTTNVDTDPLPKPGMVRIYRGQGTPVSLPDWIKQAHDENGQSAAAGRWWTTDPAIAKWYADDAVNGHMVYQDVPAEVVERSRVTKAAPDVQRFSLDPDNELFLPSEFAGKGAPVSGTAAAGEAGAGTAAAIEPTVEQQRRAARMAGLERERLAGEPSQPDILGGPEISGEALAQRQRDQDDAARLLEELRRERLSVGEMRDAINAAEVARGAKMLALRELNRRPSIPQRSEIAAPQQEKPGEVVRTRSITAPSLRIEPFSDKAIIVKGETKANLDRIKAAIGQRPIWNKKAGGWIFPKRRETEVRAALADLLGEPSGGQQVAEPEQERPTAESQGFKVEGAINKSTTPAQTPARAGPSVNIADWNAFTPDQITPDQYKDLVTSVADQDVQELGQVDMDALAQRLGLPRYARATRAGKVVEEIAEAGLAMRYREAIGGDLSFDRAVSAYDSQPALGTRTGASTANQAYSTPVPIGIALARALNLKGVGRVLEPTAGTGLLLVGTRRLDRAAVNELDPLRLELLKAQGFDPISVDATSKDLPAGPFDAVIMNPPFGTRQTETGRREPLAVFDPATGEPIYRGGALDQAIALNAAMRLKPGGKFGLVMAGPNPKLLDVETTRRQSYSAKVPFFSMLNRHFDIERHVTIPGKLYEKQGAGWPIDIIVGTRRETPLSREEVAPILPSKVAPTLAANWQELQDALVRTDARRPTVSGRPGPEPQRPPIAGPEVVSADRPAVAAERPTGEGGRQGSGGERRPVGTAGQPGAAPTGVAGRPGVRRSGGAEGAREPVPGGEARGSAGAPIVPPRNVAAPAARGRSRLESPEPTELQAAYKPTSKREPLGTLTPVALAEPSRQALAELKARAGNLDDFVRKELGYKSLDETILGAEQIDAVALAIDNAKRGRGFVIGDQTGIGKGVVVASMIRWARRNGIVPVFMTEKPSLYLDMLFRDLPDVGETGLRPFATNSGFDGSKSLEHESGGKIAIPRNQKAVMQTVAQGGKLEGYDVVFTTYDQANTSKAQLADRHRFLDALAPNAFFILDESHNAGGTGVTWEDVQQAAEQGNPKLPRELLIREWLGKAKAAMFSSATWAKRPQTMTLYATRTDIGLAVPGESVESIFARGGVPMQQAVSAMLARNGQYIRREKSFKGIEFKEKTLEIDPKEIDKFSEALGNIVEWDKSYGKAIRTRHRERMGGAARGGDAQQAVDTSEFTSVMATVLDQVFTAFKVNAIADEALEALKRGEKPVVAFDNTMGSILSEMVARGEAAPGGPVAFKVSDLIKRYLARRLSHTFTDPLSKAKERVWIEPGFLSSSEQAAFDAVAEQIESELGATGIPGSPIDAVIARLEAEGYKVGEITGRGLRVDYGAGKLLARKDAGSPEARAKTVADFNDGHLDALVVNRSGATGISMHASERVKDQRKRTMILGQFEKNIDTFLQMLGRVNRTGQIVPPGYVIPSSNIPAENRLLAVLKRKLVSLQANLSASGRGQVDINKVPDFLNELGDAAAYNVLLDEPEWRQAMALKMPDEEPASEGAFVRRATGRVALLPVAEQERFYDRLLEEYHGEYARRVAEGRQIGAAELQELDAKPVARSVYRVADGPSAFQGPVNAVQADVALLARPPTWEGTESELERSFGSETDRQSAAEAAIEQARTAARKEVEAVEKQRQRLDRQMEKLAEQRAKAKTDEEMKAVMGQATVVGELIKAHENAVERITKVSGETIANLRGFPPGTSFAIDRGEDGGGRVVGRIVGLVRNKRVKSAYSPSAWRFVAAMASVRPPRMDFNIRGFSKEKPSHVQEWEAEGAFKEINDRTALGREQRVVLTGNIPRAMALAPKTAQIIQFKDATGRAGEGVLMPPHIQTLEGAEARSLAFRELEGALKFVATDGANLVIKPSPNERPEFSIERNGDDLELYAPSSGKRFATNKAVRQAIAPADMVRRWSGGRYEATVPASRGKALVNALLGMKVALWPANQIDRAKQIQGIGAGEAVQMEAERGLFEQLDQLGEEQLSSVRRFGRKPSVSQAERDADPIIKIVKRIIRQINPDPDLAIEFEREMFASGETVARHGLDPTKLVEQTGAYSPAQHLIRLAMKLYGRERIAAAFHESWHSIERLLTEPERAALLRAYPTLDGVSHVERTAIAFEKYALAEAFDEKVPAPTSAVRRIFAKLKRALMEAARAFRVRFGKLTVDEVFARAFTGEVGARYEQLPAGRTTVDQDTGAVRPLRGKGEASSMATQTETTPTEGRPEMHPSWLEPAGQAQPPPKERAAPSSQSKPPNDQEMSRIVGRTARPASGAVDLPRQWQSPTGKIWDWWLGPLFARYYETMGRLPGGKAAYMLPRHRAQGEIAAVDAAGRRLFERLERHSDAEKEAIYQYLTNKDATWGASIPAQVRKDGEFAKRMIDVVGREMVARGVLDEAQYEKYRDAYLPRIYLKFLFATEGVGIGGANRPIVSKEMVGRLKKRSDIPEWERRILLGEIKDPAYLASRAFGEAARSIAIWDLLAKVSENPNWVYPESLVEWRGKKVTGRWLISEAQRLRRMKSHYPEADRAEVARAADEMEDLANTALEPAGNVPNPQDYKQVPDSKRYGQLRGLWVRKEIHDDLVGSVLATYDDEMLKRVANAGRRANSVWKGFKTAWSISGQARNFVSGAMQAQIYGKVPMARIPDRAIAALHSMATNGEAWRRAKDWGVKGTSFAQAELLQIHNEFKLKLALAHYKSSPLRFMRELASRINEKVGDAYSLNEQLWKTLVLDYHVSHGMAEGQAAELAHRAIFDYSDVPNMVRYLRSTPLPIGSPFMTFTYKTIPIAIETALKRPWAYLPYAALVYGSWGFLQALYDLSKDEAEALWKVVPEWLDHGLVAFLPTKDEHGRWQPVDLGYIFPFAPVWQMLNDASRGRGAELLRDLGVGSHPGFSIPAALKANQDWQGKPIYTEGAPRQQQLYEVFSYLAGQILPPWAGPTGQLAKLGDALQGRQTRFGEPGLTPEQAAARLLGVNVYPLDAAQSRETKLYLLNRDVSDAKQVMSRTAKDRSLSPSERRAALVKQRDHVRDLMAKVREYGYESARAPR